jgi:hypothetical protein
MSVCPARGSAHAWNLRFSWCCWWSSQPSRHNAIHSGIQAPSTNISVEPAATIFRIVQVTLVTLPWGWRQQAPLKHWCICASLYSVILGVRNFQVLYYLTVCTLSNYHDPSTTWYILQTICCWWVAIVHTFIITEICVKFYTELSWLV